MKLFALVVVCVSLGLGFGWASAESQLAKVAELETKVQAGDSRAIRELMKIELDGHEAEERDIILGRVIRVRPKEFLVSLSESRRAKCERCLPGLLGNLGEEYVDNFEAQAAELRRRSEALRSVGSLNLVPLRDACIKVLESQISQADDLAAKYPSEEGTPE